MSNSDRIFEVEIIENGKYYNILAAYKVKSLENGETHNILVPYKEDAEVKNSPKYEEGVINIWLRKKPNEGYFISTLERVRAIQDEGKANQDRGHLIAKMFKKYLLTSSELKKIEKKLIIFLEYAMVKILDTIILYPIAILKNLEGNYFTSKKFKLF